MGELHVQPLRQPVLSFFFYTLVPLKDSPSYLLNVLDVVGSLTTSSQIRDPSSDSYQWTDLDTDSS